MARSEELAHKLYLGRCSFINTRNVITQTDIWRQVSDLAAEEEDEEAFEEAFKQLEFLRRIRTNE